MAGLLLMPSVATGDTEAVLSQWLVPVGTAFKADDAIAVLETAKAAVDLAAEADGVILKALVGEGAEVSVGTAIAIVGAPGEQVDDLDAVLSELGVTDGVVGTPAPAADEPDPAAPVGGTVAVPSPEPVSAEPANAGAVHAETPSATRIFASPLARRLAREFGIELHELDGTGPGGRIVRDDVRAAQARRGDTATAPATATVTAPPLPAASGYQDVPHSRLRRMIARRLVESVTTAPHFAVSGQAVVDRLLSLRADLNAEFAASGTDVKVSVNDLIVAAVAHAHRAVPMMNVIWTPDAVRQFHSVDVAIAVNAPNGLVTPVVRGVDRMRLTDLVRRTRALTDQARQGRLRPEDLEGGSISVSNLGMYGTRTFTAIINPPHAAILAVGAALPEVLVVDGAPAVGTVLKMTVSVDHRPVDGAVAAEWMRALVRVLENPIGLVM